MKKKLKDIIGRVKPDSYSEITEITTENVQLDN